MILGPVYFASLVPIKEDLLENCPSCCVCMVFFFFFPPTITRTVTLIIYSTDCVCVTQNRNVFSTYSKSPVFFSLTLFLFLYLTYSRCLHCQFVPICDWWNEITPCFFFFCLFIRGGIAKFHNDAQYQFPCSCAANCIYAILINFSKSLMRFKCAPQHTHSLSFVCYSLVNAIEMNQSLFGWLLHFLFPLCSLYHNSIACIIENEPNRTTFISWLLLLLLCCARNLYWHFHACFMPLQPLFLLLYLHVLSPFFF